MKIKRTEKRLVASGAHPYFEKNKEKWKKLNRGDVIDIPKDEFDSISVVFGGTIEVADKVSPVEAIDEFVESVDDSEDKGE